MGTSLKSRIMRQKESATVSLCLKFFFGTVKVKKTSYYRNNESISHILELNFGKKEDF